jgi:hypothetical protein
MLSDIESRLRWRIAGRSVCSVGYIANHRAWRQAADTLHAYHIATL